MKNIKFYCVTAIIIILLTFSCSKNDDINTNELLGNWISQEDYKNYNSGDIVVYSFKEGSKGVIYVFNNDDSYTEYNEITWSISEDELTLSANDKSGTTRFLVSGDVLTLYDDIDPSDVYYKIDIPLELIN